MPRTVFDPTVSPQHPALKDIGDDQSLGRKRSPRSFSYAPRPRSLNGLRLGLVENTKFNSDVLLLKIAQRLHERYGTTMVHLDRKKSSGHSVSDETLARFQHQADLVLAGVGD